ncbi:hypothetical protein GQ457_02G017660 [Hibiscus cannabinus]
MAVKLAVEEDEFEDLFTRFGKSHARHFSRSRFYKPFFFPGFLLHVLSKEIKEEKRAGFGSFNRKIIGVI